MRIERVVVNASPLITLFRSQQADLLPRVTGHGSRVTGHGSRVTRVTRVNGVRLDRYVRSWRLQQ